MAGVFCWDLQNRKPDMHGKIFRMERAWILLVYRTWERMQMGKGKNSMWNIFPYKLQIGDKSIDKSITKCYHLTRNKEGLTSIC